MEVQILHRNISKEIFKSFFSKTIILEKLKLVWNHLPEVEFKFVQIMVPKVGWGHSGMEGSKFYTGI